MVPGNLYDENDTLLVIAPLDHLWVWGNVFESDLDLVRLGQDWEIEFPFLDHRLSGQVEHISNRVDPGTHAVRVRTSIPNVNNRLKADMLVRGLLAILPTPGRTIIPRTALIVADGAFYVFVRAGGSPEKFERRSVRVAHEKDDHAVIEEGLRPGEEVVNVGALSWTNSMRAWRRPTRVPRVPGRRRGTEEAADDPASSAKTFQPTKSRRPTMTQGRVVDARRLTASGPNLLFRAALRSRTRMETRGARLDRALRTGLVCVIALCSAISRPTPRGPPRSRSRPDRPEEGSGSGRRYARLPRLGLGETPGESSRPLGLRPGPSVSRAPVGGLEIPTTDDRSKHRLGPAPPKSRRPGSPSTASCPSREGPECRVRPRGWISTRRSRS